MNIDSFIKKLSEYKSSDTVNNMYYGDSKNAIERRNRLKNYLSSIKNPMYIFVGEAPGYKGCARTGVPFTSDDGEMSARVMNEAFKKELPSITPLMWNAFPFHPHEKGDLNTNRKPTTKELIIGQEFLRDLLIIFPSVKYFFAVGRTSEKLLKETVDPRQVEYIRHPAHGGKKECQLGIKTAIMRFSAVDDWDRLLRELGEDHRYYTLNNYKEPPIINGYEFLKKHEAEFRNWYFEGDHDEYPWAFFDYLEQKRKSRKFSKKCPNCGAKLKKILYGLPDGEIDLEEYEIGGCCITDDDPKLVCSECGFRYSNNLKKVYDFIPEEHLGKIITVKIDRPMGSKHQKHGFIYPVNYGYVPGTIAADGEEIDAYLLGVYKPVKKFTGHLIAIVHRDDDEEEKLIVAPRTYSAGQIMALIDFQERWFKSYVSRIYTDKKWPEEKN